MREKPVFDEEANSPTNEEQVNKWRLPLLYLYLCTHCEKEDRYCLVKGCFHDAKYLL